VKHHVSLPDGHCAQCMGEAQKTEADVWLEDADDEGLTIVDEPLPEPFVAVTKERPKDGAKKKRPVIIDDPSSDLLTEDISAKKRIY